METLMVVVEPIVIRQHR